MLMATLTVIAVVLTTTMFATRQAMLGFPSAMFWAILGGYAYTQSTVPWGDIYFYFAFASLLGMTTFCALGAFALRERRDTIADVEMQDEEEGGEEEGAFIDEVTSKPSKRTQALRDRAKQRKDRRRGEGL